MRCDQAHLAVLLLGLLCFGRVAADGGIKEAEVKAAFVYQIVKFVDWPDSSSPSGEFRLCLQGADEDFSRALKSIQGKEVQPGLRFGVYSPAKGESLVNCQALVIGERIDRPLNTILNELKDRPVLTLSDQDGFFDHGGMIGLVTVDRRVRFEINLEAAQRSHMQISAQLLKLALKVRR